MHRDPDRRYHSIYVGIRSVIPGKLEEYVALDRGVSKDGLPRATEWKFDTFDLRRRVESPRSYEHYSQYLCVGATNNKRRFKTIMGYIFGELRGTRKMKFPNGERGYMHEHKGRRKTILPHLAFLSYTLSRLMEKPFFFPIRNLEEFQEGYRSRHHSRRPRRVALISPFNAGTITGARENRIMKAHVAARTKNKFGREKSEWSSWDPHTNQVIRSDDHHNGQYSLNRSSSSYGYSTGHHTPSYYSQSQGSRSVSGDSYKHRSSHHDSRDHDYDDTRSRHSRDSGYGSSISDYSDRSSSSSRSKNHHSSLHKRHKSQGSGYADSYDGGPQYSDDGLSDIDDYRSTTSRGTRYKPGGPGGVSLETQELVDRQRAAGLIPPSSSDRIPDSLYDQHGNPLPRYLIEAQRHSIANYDRNSGY
ncbi:hypothetical protein ACMFMG_007547 [Clarireedia jacksonii]